MDVRRQIAVSGIVQGVGFRPYVYRLARERKLAGRISNTPFGVSIEVQGPSEQVEDFVTQLPREAPPLAKITEVAVAELPCNGDRDFRIVASQRGEAVRTLISPDVATCPDCLREMLDPTDRRYRYPFINCTKCGPRFTIVHDIPYDRPHTSMSVFPMCPACQGEYENPLNRRFHAQPNACWDCGPRLELLGRDGGVVGDRDPLTGAIEAIRQGRIVAVKGLGGFHLVADATNSAAVMLLRERKRRVEKPFAVMVPSLETARRLCQVGYPAEMALQSMERPIVLLRRKYPNPIVDEVAPFNRELGVFLPYTPLHHLLFAEGRFEALVMTSGNLSEEPIAIANHEALERLGGLADLFLMHNRDILLRCDDSVVRVVSGKARQMRRSRGFVPVPVFLKDELPPVLAVGGELKNTICVTKGKHAFLSQHIGDLENLESYKFFEQAIAHLSKVLEIEPKIVAYDLHPDYFSTKWALQQSGMQAVGIQHHHAHIASCMAENHVEGRVLGVALDGTGYGTDGHIWGGEVLVAGYQGFERMAHLEYVSLPGGSAAVAEPWRMAVSYLHHHFGRAILNWQIPFVQQLDCGKTEFLLQMIEKGVNSPLTSSCGRLFDAVAALAGIRKQINYEAQAAIELEMAIDASVREPAYPLDLIRVEGQWIISTRRLFQEIVRDIERNRPVSVISRRFHDGLVEVFARLANLVRQRTWLDQVCLSGGTFHNRYLLENLVARLKEQGFEVFAHSEVPAGDGGLSLGQALVAAHQVKDAATNVDVTTSRPKIFHA
jgi:hydrogenase maturation protein HypF